MDVIINILNWNQQTDREAEANFAKSLCTYIQAFSMHVIWVLQTHFILFRVTNLWRDF